jgi:hypothetical protein
MANTVSRLTANGNLFITGQFDEVTFDINAGYNKNLFKSSSNLSNLSYWNPLGAGNVVSSYATTAPDGTNTAYKLIPKAGLSPGSGSSEILNQSTGSGVMYIGVTYTQSIYIKNAEFNGLRIRDNSTGQTFDFFPGTNPTAVGSVLNPKLTPYNNGWYRASWSFLGESIGGGQSRADNWSIRCTQTGDGTSGIYIWGPQLELGSLVTIYEATGPYSAGQIPPPLAGPPSRLDNTGNMYVGGLYDEFTKGMNLVQNGLIYYMDPSKPECWNGNTALYDLTGTNPPGVLVGGYRYSPEAGGVITLDGLTGYANTNILGTNPIFQSTQSFTMSIWCKFTGPSKSGSGGTSTLFGCFSFQGFGIVWQGGTNINVNTLYAGLRINTGAEDLTYTSDTRNFQTNKWYNYVLSYSGPSNFNYLYVNGSTSGNSGQQTSTNLPYSSAIQGLGITIGNILQESGGQAGYFPGQIGQALIYNRALSAAEINQNFQEMRSQYGV